VACRALALVYVFATPQRAVGITNFNRANLLNALCLGQLMHANARTRFGGGAHKVHQADDQNHGQDESEYNRNQQLLGVLDGAGVAFFVVLVAHGVLWLSGAGKTNGGLYRAPIFYSVPQRPFGVHCGTELTQLNDW
jgi:hypothetical protein